MREVVHGASKCGTYVLTTNNILKAQSEHEKKKKKSSCKESKKIKSHTFYVVET